MNPHVTVSLLEIVFPFLMTAILVSQAWRLRPALTDRLYDIGSFLIVVAFASASIVNLFYQGKFDVRAWPTTGVFDQVIVTPNGDVYLKLVDTIMGRTNRVQRYGCDGRFRSAFKPDNGGGLFKIAVDGGERLLIYSLRTDTIDTFDPDGTFVERQEMDSRKMPFNFLIDGPSITKAGSCEFGIDPESRQYVVKTSTGSSLELEQGDWLLEHALNRWNILGMALLGGALVATSFIR